MKPIWEALGPTLENLSICDVVTSFISPAPTSDDDVLFPPVAIQEKECSPALCIDDIIKQFKKLTHLSFERNGPEFRDWFPLPLALKLGSQLRVDGGSLSSGSRAL